MTDQGIVVGTYIGKEHKKKGTKKDGEPWHLFKAKIKVNETDQYPRTFDVFDSCKGLDDIQEGDNVKAGFVLGDPFKTQYGSTVTPKQMLWVGKSDDAPQYTEPGKQNTTTTPAKQDAPMLVTEELRKKVRENYLETCKKHRQEPSKNHYIGTAILMAAIAQANQAKIQWAIDDFQKYIEPKLNDNEEDSNVPEEVVM